MTSALFLNYEALFSIWSLVRVCREGSELAWDAGRSRARITGVNLDCLRPWLWGLLLLAGIPGWPGEALNRLSLSVPNTMACQAEPSSFCSAPDTSRPRSQEATETKDFISLRLSCGSAGLLGPALDSIKSQAQMTEAEFRALSDGSWDSSCQLEASDHSRAGGDSGACERAGVMLCRASATLRLLLFIIPLDNRAHSSPLQATNCSGAEGWQPNY